MKTITYVHFINFFFLAGGGGGGGGGGLEGHRASIMGDLKLVNKGPSIITN